MIQLIKKDLIVSIKLKSMKAAIITFIVALFLLSAFSYIYPTILPIIITYMVVINSFYYDDLDNSESYILSLPNKREDVVYSKYSLVLLILFLSNVLMYILFGINILSSPRIMVFQDVVINISTILFGFGIILPVIFKSGYKKARFIAPIGMIITFITISKVVKSIVEFLGDNYSPKIVTSFFLFIIVNLLLYIISMGNSLKIFKNKDIG